MCSSDLVTSGLPSGGGSRQQSIARVGQDGDGSRFLGYIMAHPGQHYPYTEMQGLTDGKTAIMAGSHITEGWGSVGWVVQLPPWEEDNVTRDKSQPIEVQVSGGSTYAEVQFGYARFGAPGQFFCTARAEACNT